MAALFEKLFDWIRLVLSWVVEFFVWLAVKVFQLVADALVYVLSIIPVPDFMTGLSTNIAAVDPGVWYFTGAFEFGTGITWMLGALVIRFCIRRLPVIG